MDDRLLTHYDEKHNEQEYLNDEANCAAHAQAKEAILNMPDYLVMNIIIEWARTKGYEVTIRGLK
jgi:hypothetical protein